MVGAPVVVGPAAVVESCALVAGSSSLVAAVPGAAVLASVAVGSGESGKMQPAQATGSTAATRQRRRITGHKRGTPHRRGQTGRGDQ
ncbi:hypothetical protein [Nannocystis pusilla]|uniref:hypothetical protein n=1 Tax=Nannocystis pusilla TaxID=889268 RepID=UPI003B7AC0EB